MEASRMTRVAETVIRLEKVSVCFRVPLDPIRSFKEYAIRSLLGRLDFREVWALRDVSFEVGRGEVVGIIGRNGSGKSTLLRVIARVLRPTSGRIWVKGRVAPLLELGGGFHPELTGRENIFLNGCLLGRTRQEVAERFDEIVDFAELREFIDAPLRTYSTGMVARLGFAVATAWEPEILLVDEVLAVGDQDFQKKCQARMETFRACGTTILLVSHNLEMVRKMCQRAIWLEHGRIQAIGSPDEVISRYQDA
jgi:ABC-2 type transport system ATP-binding protein/lipopolysaccharide transport system ATP-binding protein